MAIAGLSSDPRSLQKTYAMLALANGAGAPWGIRSVSPSADSDINVFKVKK